MPEQTVLSDQTGAVSTLSAPSFDILGQHPILLNKLVHIIVRF